MPSKVFVLVSLMLVCMIVQCHAKLLSFSDEQKTSSSFEFIKTLQGSQKGARVKGLNEIKKYLRHFGYLSDSYEVQIPRNHEDNFDDALESAIKTYQVNYNLNVTGTLDVETLSMMMLPRCGVPDIVNGETSMRSGKDKTMQDYHGQNKKKVHMVSHYKLFNRRQKWPSSKPSLTYGFTTNGSDDPFLNLVGRAFDQWVSGTNSRFTFSRVQNFANIKIGVYSRSHFDGYPFDGPYGTLAHAFPPTDGRLHFDGDEDWALGSTAGPTEIHMESVAVHEIGHIMGLNHSSVMSSIMFPYINPGEIKVNVTGDDIDGIDDLYG